MGPNPAAICAQAYIAAGFPAQRVPRCHFLGQWDMLSGMTTPKLHQPCSTMREFRRAGWFTPRPIVPLFAVSGTLMARRMRLPQL